MREKEAAHLRLRVSTLDAEVSRARAQLEMEEQTRTIHLETFEPWPEAVDGAEVLNGILDRFSVYVFMPPGAAVACTLWTAHVPAFDAFHLSPRLNLTSEFGGCGKTTVLDLIAALVSRALRFESLTPAVLFRIINLLAPVLLLDEVDTYLPQSDELRGVLNAGHKRNSHAYRCEGERYTIRAFKAFAPAVLAGIGELPGTLRDRSIIIHMSPAPAGQQLTRFDPLHLETETALARKLVRWATDNFGALAACDPPLPATAFNRLADNWRPLFSVAQMAGGDWPERALDAFNQVTAAAHHRTESLTKKLLRDIAALFAQAKAERLFSSTMVEMLLAMPGRPWGQANKGNSAINQQWLSRRLLPLGITPRTMRIDEGRAKGYFASDFGEVFASIPSGK